MEVEHSYILGLPIGNPRRGRFFTWLGFSARRPLFDSRRGLVRSARPLNSTRQTSTLKTTHQRINNDPGRPRSTLPTPLSSRPQHRESRLSLPFSPSALASGSFDQARTFPPLDEPSFENFRNLTTSMETTPLVQPSVRSFAACFAVCWGGRGGVYALPAGELRAKMHRTPLLLFVDSLATRAFPSYLSELALCRLSLARGTDSFIVSLLGTRLCGVRGRVLPSGRLGLVCHLSRPLAVSRPFLRPYLGRPVQPQVRVLLLPFPSCF